MPSHSFISTGTGFPDRVAAASDAAACCNLCALEVDCGAFTFGPASDCELWIPGAPGCCYMKVRLEARFQGL